MLTRGARKRNWAEFLEAHKDDVDGEGEEEAKQKYAVASKPRLQKRFKRNASQTQKTVNIEQLQTKVETTASTSGKQTTAKLKILALVDQMPVDLKQSKLKKNVEVQNSFSQGAGRQRNGPGRSRSKSTRQRQPMVQKSNNDQKPGRAGSGKLAQVYAKVDKAAKKITDDKAIIPQLQ